MTEARHEGANSNQNRSISSWIAPDSSFSADLWLENLSTAEFGALLFLLTMPEGHHHRLGFGKPLGFGSVHLSVSWEESEIYPAQSGGAPGAISSRYTAFNEPPSLEGADLETFSAPYLEAYEDALGQLAGVAEAKRIIEIFLQASRGGVGPVHYPRAAAAQGGDIFTWFTNNEQGVKISLPEGVGPLPYNQPPP